MLSILITFAFTDTSNAETVLNFSDVLDKSIKKSYDIKLTKIEEKISAINVDETQYLLYPEINMGFNTEYSKDLQANSRVSAVGDTVYSGSTSYQNAASINLSYNFIDFGVRRKQVKIAELDAEASTNNTQRTVLELKIFLVELYARNLSAFKDIQTQKMLLSIQNEKLNFLQRSCETGLYSKTEVIDQLKVISETQRAIQSFTATYQISLQDLSYHTGEKYDANEVKISSFEFINEPFREMDFKSHPEYKAYEINIRKKQIEAESQLVSLMPEVNFYARYNFLGADTSSYPESYDDMEERSYIIGFSTSLPIFASFKKRHTWSKIKHEKKRYEIGRNQKEAELSTTYSKTKTAYLSMNKEIEHLKKMLVLIDEKITQLTHLTRQRMIEPISLLNEKRDHVNQKLYLEKRIISSMLELKKLKFMTMQY